MHGLESPNKIEFQNFHFPNFNLIIKVDVVTIYPLFPSSSLLTFLDHHFDNLSHQIHVTRGHS